MSYLIQQTPEWHAMRKTKIGASDAPAILGLTPWKTAIQVYHEKVGVSPQVEKNEAMEWGLLQEPAARAYFESSYGKKVQPAVRFHPEYDWMMASLDGINDKDEVILEIKCPYHKANHLLAQKNTIPEYYLCQMQHQMAVVGYKKAYYVSYYLDRINLNEDVVVIPVERNDSFIENTLIPKLKEFYQHIINKQEPGPEWQGFRQQESNQWLVAASEWENLSAQIKELTDKQEKVRKKLIELADGKNSIGGGIKLIKAIKKGLVDYSAIPQLKIIDLEKYRKPDTEYWTVRAG